jgi:HEAT repeat protein
VTTDNHPQFINYLQSISEEYKRWWNLYTLTDAEGKKSRFDFDLMVERVQPNQEQEKKERLPVLSGIRKYAAQHVLLVGKPGSGKSTALQRLLWEDAEAIIQGNKRRIPVLVELRNWDTSIENVETLIYKFLRKNKHRIDKDKIEDLLFDGELLLLMDGLNELPSDEARERVARFRRDYSETPMIFTTRDLGVGGNLGIEKQLEMQSLSENQMREFVQKYLPKQHEQMLQQLGNRLRELGETPLILKMLCDVFTLSGEIPKSRGELFRQFDNKVNYLKEDKETVAIPDGLRRWKGELLQYLAFEMMQPENPQGNPTDFRLSISRSQTEAILEDFLKRGVEFPAQKAKEWLDGLLKHCLVENKASESWQAVIQFHHQLFQEYYAAEYLLRLLPNLSDAKLKRDYLNLLKWTEPVALMLALVENEAQALRVVKLALDVDLMQAARLAGEVKSEFQKKTIGLILEKKLPHKIEITILGITKSEFAVGNLNNYLHNYSSDDIYFLTIQTLASICNEAAASTLSNFVDNEDYIISFIATRTLVKVANKTSVDALICALKSKSPKVRSRAARGLGEIGSELAVKPLIDALNDKDRGVISNAMGALEKIGNEDGLKALKSSELYWFYSIPLNKLKHNNQPTALNHDNSLSRHKVDIDIIIKNRFGYITYSEAIKATLPLLTHQEMRVRINATEFLIEIINEKNIDIQFLIAELRNQNPEIRWRVTEVLAQIGTKASPAINNLIFALADKNKEVRWRAAESLGNIKNEIAVTPLIPALQDEDSEVRWRAAEALGKIGSETAVSSLINALNDDYGIVRSCAAEALRKIGNSDIVSQLWKLFKSGIDEAKYIILAIQNRCNFYNHDIFHSPPLEEDKNSDNPTSSNTYNFNAPVGNVNAGDTNIQSQIGIQNN